MNNTLEPQWKNNEQARKWESAESSIAVHAAREHIPLGATFEITPFCNLKCKMCYVRLDKHQAGLIGKELTAKQWISIAEETIKLGTLDLLITGGEPLLRKDFPEIYTALCNMGFIVSINTNATLMTEELKDLFCKYPPTSANITLYGASDETYEELCGDASGFERTLRGLDMLSQVPTNLEIRTTFTKNNLHELDDVRAIANRYTNRFAINVQVFKAIRGAVSEADNCRLTPEQALDIERQNLLYYKNLASKQEDKKNGPAITPRPAEFYGYDIPPAILSCLAAKSMYWITWDGKMIPCGSFSNPYTLPLEEGLNAAWDRLPSLFENLKPPEMCAGCSIAAESGCPNCPANLQAETGSLDTIAPYLCEYAKARKQRISEYRKFL